MLTLTLTFGTNLVLNDGLDVRSERVQFVELFVEFCVMGDTIGINVCLGMFELPDEFCNTKRSLEFVRAYATELVKLVWVADLTLGLVGAVLVLTFPMFTFLEFLVVHLHRLCNQRAVLEDVGMCPAEWKWCSISTQCRCLMTSWHGTDGFFVHWHGVVVVVVDRSHFCCCCCCCDLNEANWIMTLSSRGLSSCSMENTPGPLLSYVALSNVAAVIDNPCSQYVV